MAEAPDKKDISEEVSGLGTSTMAEGHKPEISEPGTFSDPVSHSDGGLKKFFSKVKKLSKRVTVLSESSAPTLSPGGREQVPSASADPETKPSSNKYPDDVFFGESFHDSSTNNQPPSECVYDFGYTTRGVAVLIINTTFKNTKMSPERKYAEHDITIFKEILTSLNFSIRILQNKPTSELLQKLDEIRQSLIADCDCFLCVISSHGLETRISEDRRKRQHTVFTYDGWIATHLLIEKFKEDVCRRLAGKPKLFFIQACRSVHGAQDYAGVDKGVFTTVADVHNRPSGRDISDQPYGEEETVQNTDDSNSDSGPNHRHERSSEVSHVPHELSELIRRRLNIEHIPFADEDVSNNSYYTSRLPGSRMHPDDVDFCTIPCYPHLLVMFSSAPEHFAWSDDYKGGWLPYCMYQVLRKMYKGHFQIDLLQALTEVNNKMALDLETNRPRDSTTHLAKSAACIYHMLTKDIYFTPKYAPRSRYTPGIDPVPESAV